MKKNDRVKILNLTQHIIEQYWLRNLTPLLEHLDEDILWIGSMDEEYVHGKEKMLERVYENKEAMPPVYLDQQEYSIVQNERESCVVAGRYRGFTKPDSGMILSEKQRITFVWVKESSDAGPEYLIKHIHLSNVLHIQSEEERFPTRAGKDNYEYVQRVLAERSLGEVISVKDRDRVNRILNYSDIMYLKADGNYVQVHMADEKENFSVREPFSELIEKLPEGFIKVSRSVVSTGAM